VSAFEASSGLIIVLNVKAPSGSSVDSFGVPTYLDPSGRQSTAGYWASPDGLQPGGSSFLMYQFARGKLGGVMAWEFWPPNGNYRVKMPIR